jgi:hypothetical protein
MIDFDDDEGCSLLSVSEWLTLIETPAYKDYARRADEEIKAEIARADE